MSNELVPIGPSRVLAASEELGGPPAIIQAAGGAALFAWDEFFSAELRNTHTRKAYRRAVRLFLAWCEARGLELALVTPGMVGRYFDEHPGSPPTKKLHLAAVRRLFDKLVTRLSMDPNRYEVSEPELLRGLRLSRRGSYLQDGPGFSVFTGSLAIHPRVLLVPPRASRGQGSGPESLRVPAVSTLGFLHDRGPSNRIVQAPDAPLRQRRRLLHDRHV